MTLKKPWTLLIITIACLFWVFGLYWRATSQKTLRLAKTLSTTNSPERIVSLAPNLTEILFALGLGEKIVAVSSDSNYPPQAAKKRKTGTFWQPNIEAIIASKPDLVITLGFEQQKAVADSLNRLGYQVLSLEMEKIDELLEAIQKIGAATGYERNAEELISNIRNQMENIQSKLISTNKVKTLWVVQVEPLRIAGRETFVNELLELAGGENAIGPTIQHYPQIGTEGLFACNPEVIFQSAMEAGNLDKQQKVAEIFWSKWVNLPAVKNNRIYVVKPDTTLRLGPRLCQGIKLIAHFLHPDVFTQRPDTLENQVNQ